MFLLYLAIWIILNGHITPEIIIFGVLISAGITAVRNRLLGRSAADDVLRLRYVPFLLRYGAVLLREIILASLSVMKMAFSVNGKPDPVIVRFHSGLPTESQNVLLANSITLTPGTYTIFQEGDYLTVHSLCPAYAEGIEESCFIRLLRELGMEEDSHAD